MKSTPVRILGSSPYLAFGSLIPRKRRFSANLSGIDLLLSTGCTLPPRTISKLRCSRVRSILPLALEHSHPFSVQRRWCSLLCAVVNPAFAWKCTTCFCLSISELNLCLPCHPFPARLAVHGWHSLHLTWSKWVLSYQPPSICGRRASPSLKKCHSPQGGFASRHKAA